MKQLSDNSLLELIQSENHLAFSALVDRYWVKLYKHLCFRIRNENEAKDIVQDIFLSLWNNRNTVFCDDSGSIAPYLFKAARYCAIDYFSKPETTIPYENALSAVLLYPSKAEADESFLLKELENLISKELAEMPDRLQKPFMLSREGQLSIKEIAKQLSLSEQTVKNNISTVIQRLKLKVTHYNSDTTICLILALAALKR